MYSFKLNKIEQINKPEYNVVNDFGMKINGEIIYQFYNQYGNTDIEEHLIMIVKQDNISFLNSSLPLDSTDIKKLSRINFRKFTMGKPVNIEPEKKCQEDIRNESREFKGRKETYVFYGEGKYGITFNDSIETLYVFDNKTGLMYVESKNVK